MQTFKIECVACEHVFRAPAGGSITCPKCGSRKGGFMQEPSMKKIGSDSFHLNETLVHKKSGNEFKIKEIQASGFLVRMTKSLVKSLYPDNSKFYISYSQMNEYGLKQ